MRPLSFTIEKQMEGRLGRAGSLSTVHGIIKTPAFLPVGTKGTIKSLLPEYFERLGIQGLLANTYHLFLQPGEDIVEKAGGIHSFMNYSGPVMTDSGGFQVFSLGEAFGKGVTKFATGEVSEEIRHPNVYSKDLATEHGKLAIIDEEGVTFTSHIDGSMHRFTAERSIEIQHKIGADIIVAFDECTSPTAEYEYQKEAMERTHRWADRSLKAHRNNVEANKQQGIYAVVQGGRHLDLRKESATVLGEMGLDRSGESRGGFDGFGIGGSFSKEDLGESLIVVNEILPEDKPRHMLGIGEPEDIFVAIENGCDTFDCVSPTRLARTGTLYTREGKIDITKSLYREDMTLLGGWCDVLEGSTFTRSYLHHLFRAREMLGSVLATIINLQFLLSLTENIRISILEETYSSFKEDFLRDYQG